MSYIDKIYVASEVLGNKYTQKIINHYENVEINELAGNRINELQRDYEKQKGILFLKKSKGEIVQGCPGTDENYLCCKYQVINQTLNCPLNCSYCILQHYLDVPNVIYTDFENIFAELSRKLEKQPDRFFRIGTGELGDSAALYGSRLFAKELMTRFSDRENLLLEFKTKSMHVEPIINTPHEGKVVISWSLNPDLIARKEESKASPILDRLKAAREAYQNGFLVGFHFDPILEWNNWEELYTNLIDKMYNNVPPEKIAWISMGSLRFPSDNKLEIENRYPHSKIVYSEMIRGHDNKLRYLRPLRVSLYKTIYKKLTEVNHEPFIYFCMENETVWKEVMDFAPRNNSHLDYLFAKSLYRRFDDIVSKPPQFKYYKNALDLDGTHFHK